MRSIKMYVETWINVILVIDSVIPGLDEFDTGMLRSFKTWIYYQENKYFGLDAAEVEAWSQAIKLLLTQFDGQSKNDLIGIRYFLATLNHATQPEDYLTEEGCIAHEHEWTDGICVLADGGIFPPPPPLPEDITNEIDCLAMNWYWYNNACHDYPQTPGECKNYTECVLAGWYWYNDACHLEPEPVIPDPIPGDFTDQLNCESHGFYWYDSACHYTSKPVDPDPIPIPDGNMLLEYAGYLDEYLATLSILKIIERGIVILLRNWLLLLGNFLIWLKERGT